MKVELSRAKSFQSQRRLGCANGYKPRQFNRRVGKRAVKLGIAGIYVKGFSTRKVSEVILTGLTKNDVLARL